MHLLRRTLLGAVVLSATTGTLLACSDDAATPRPSFDSVDAAPDVAPDLPEAAPDAGPPEDSGIERPPFDPSDEPVVCADAGPCATELVAGSNHFCARMSDGTVRCWGDDEYGALGGSKEKGATTVLVADVGGATQLSASGSTTCARQDDGGVMCWGSNASGQLGLDADKPSWDQFPHGAAKVALTEPAERVDVGPRHACAVLGGGKLACWGTNELAQLARDGASLDFVMVPGPAAVAPLAVAATALGSGTTLARTTTGTVVSWGAVSGNEGFLGGRMSSISPDPLPNAIPGLDGVTSLVASETMFKDEGGPLGAPPTIGPIPPGPPPRHAHACALAKGEVYCWGKSDTSALCTGLPDNELWPTPAPILGKAWPQRLSAGDEITCARMTDGTIQCCGADAYGRLGTGRTQPFSAFFSPIASFEHHAVSVATSRRAVCALVQGGTVECWGSNAHGELALAEPDEDPHPKPVAIDF